MKNRAGLFFLFFTACVSDAPEEFASIKAETWNSFTNEIAGYTLSYPNELEEDKSRDGKDALFRYNGYPIICVNFVDSTEGRKRGLWLKHQPVADILLNGVQGKKYEYIHYDAFFGMLVQSYVINHKGKQLGLEFRKSGDLGTVLEKVYHSFMLTGQ
jgi:hypothetical protein